MVEVASGHVVEDSVGGDERRADMDGRSCDPQVIGVNRFVEGMANLSAGVTEPCGGRQ